MTPVWTSAIARLLVWLALGAVIGGLYGQLTLGLLIATGSYLALTIVSLFRLERWLRRPKRRNAPDLSGVWAEVMTHVFRLRRRNRLRKQRVRRLLKEFRTSTKAMPDGAIVLNDRREITWFNRAATELLHLKRRSDLGQRIDNLIRHPDFVAYLETGDFAKPVVISSPAEDGVELSLHVIPYGEAQQLLLVKNVTHQVQLEHMRRDFVANASHELRSPLTVVTGYLDGLVDDATVPTDWREPLEEMHRQAHRMNAIIEDLLELSRLESPETEEARSVVDIGGILALVRKEALALDERPGTVELDLDSDARLSGLESELHSAIANLVTNAVHYTPAEGRIDIRWWVDDDGGHVSVTDTGVGIPADSIPRLTERFYRVDPGRARDRGGTGLGLAIVKHVLHRHNGWLEIKSELGKGSVFTCHFPPDSISADAEQAPKQAAKR